MSPQGKDRTVIYSARTHTTGGRDHGMSRSSDGHLDVKLANPGSARIGTNPEQLFAAGWSACFGSAIAFAARQSKVVLGEITIDAEIHLHRADGDDSFLSARLTISIPGVDRTAARNLVRQAEQLCPYSKATCGNIDVAYELI
jgi:osmotically inducible protein OsmC